MRNLGGFRALDALPLLLPPLDPLIRPLSLADIDLPGTPDLDAAFLEHQLAPVREPADDAGDGKEDGEEVGGDAEGAVDEAGLRRRCECESAPCLSHEVRERSSKREATHVEIDIGRKTALDEIVIRKRRIAQRKCSLEERVLTRYRKDLVCEPTFTAQSCQLPTDASQEAWTDLRITLDLGS